MTILNRLVLLLFAAVIATPAVSGDGDSFFGGGSASVSLAVDRPSAPPSFEPGAFEALSPANRAIAERVFIHQLVTAQGEAPLNLDQIADTLRAGGWGEVFRRLKAEGLTRAKSVSDLVTRPRRASTSANRPATRNGRITVVTTGSGRRLFFYSKAAVGARPMVPGSGS